MWWKNVRMAVKGYGISVCKMIQKLPLFHNIHCTSYRSYQGIALDSIHLFVMEEFLWWHAEEGAPASPLQLLFSSSYSQAPWLMLGERMMMMESLLLTCYFPQQRPSLCLLRLMMIAVNERSDKVKAVSRGFLILGWRHARSAKAGALPIFYSFWVVCLLHPLHRHCRLRLCY